MVASESSKSASITLYLVRHGESVYNAEGRIQGQQDPPLSEVGLRQAELIARRLSSERFAAVYSSDLARASATAQLIAGGHGLTVQTTPLLRESRLGVVEGLTNAEIEKLYPSDTHAWRADPLNARPPGAESIEQVIERARRFLADALSKYANGSKLLVVAHGGSIRGLIIAGLGWPTRVYHRLHVSNGSLSIVVLGSVASLTLFNDTCHLASPEANGQDF